MATLVFDPQPTLGALEIGAFISILLFGIATVQVYLYFRHFPDDPRMLKAIVAFIWCCELGHSCCITSGTYIMTISYYGNPGKLIKTPNSLNAAIIFGAFVDPVVQSVYAYRMYKLSHKLLIPIVCWIIATALLVGSLVIAVDTFSMTSVQSFEAQYRAYFSAIFTGGAVLDVIILVSICYHLSQQRRKSRNRTVKVLDLLIAWTIQTGLVTSLAAVVTTICFLSMKDNYAWIAIFIDMTGLFSNSLLALLNGRTELSKIMTKNPVTSISSGNVETRHGSASVPHISIEMRQNKEEVSDFSASDPPSQMPKDDPDFKVQTTLDLESLRDMNSRVTFR